MYASPVTGLFLNRIKNGCRAIGEGHMAAGTGYRAIGVQDKLVVLFVLIIPSELIPICVFLR
jgi:hypothetical protein